MTLDGSAGLHQIDAAQAAEYRAALPSRGASTRERARAACTSNGEPAPAHASSSDPRSGALGTFAKLAAAAAQVAETTPRDSEVLRRRWRSKLQAVARRLAPRLGVSTCMMRPGVQAVDAGTVDLGMVEALNVAASRVMTSAPGRERDTAISEWRRVGRPLLHCTSTSMPEASRDLADRTTVKRTMIENPVSIGVGESGIARWQGLHTCGSAWACPWCAPRVSDERRVELVAALTRWRNVNIGLQLAERGVCMITVTTSHTLHDALVDLRDGMLAAWRDVTGHRQYRALRESLGCAGTIRATELTWGENGWHLHFHIVWLQEAPVSEADAERIKATLFPLWRAACAKHSLGAPSEQHGIDVGLGSHPDEYVTKWGAVDELCPTTAKHWGAAEELTMSALKFGRGKDSVNPWALLLAAGEGDELAARLWTEFALAMKGKAQLVWSKGLKAKLGIRDATDEEIAALVERPVVTVPLTHEDFYLLVRNGCRLKVLEVTEAAIAQGRDPHVAVMGVLGKLRDYEASGLGRRREAKPTYYNGPPDRDRERRGDKGHGCW